jgi:hypothetical protein
MLNQSDQPTQFGHFSHMDPPYQQQGYQLRDQYHVTASSWVSIRFQSWVFSFYSTDGARGRHKMVSEILRLILCIGFLGFGLLHKIFTSLSILVSGMCTVFIVYFPVISLQRSLVSGIYIAVVILRWVVLWLRLALSEGPNRVGVLPHLRTETDPVSQTLCSLFFWNTGWWALSKNPVILSFIVYHLFQLIE